VLMSATTALSMRSSASRRISSVISSPSGYGHAVSPGHAA
jgi:hypothetical protein